MMTRREAAKRTLLTTAVLATGMRPPALQAQSAPAGPFKLPPLPYAFDALEPHIDAKTMEIHHDRHHQTYVTNLNRALEGQEALSKKTVEQLVRHLDEVPDTIRMAVRNSGGGHLNHSLFWHMMKRGGGGEPKGTLAKAIERKFGNFAGFKEEFSAAATKVFGSGWAWLVLEEKELKILSTPNQDTPLSQGRHPVLGLDVWEHAYYLKYQNKRADYISAFFNLINWDFVTEQFEKNRE
jgi:Fe-Mn family superoxide dismutase